MPFWAGTSAAVGVDPAQNGDQTGRSRRQSQLIPHSPGAEISSLRSRNSAKPSVSGTREVGLVVVDLDVGHAVERERGLDHLARRLGGDPATGHVGPHPVADLPPGDRSAEFLNLLSDGLGGPALPKRHIADQSFCGRESAGLQGSGDPTVPIGTRHCD